MAHRTRLTTSWDDGSRHDVQLAEMLTDLGLTGTFYATTGPGGSRELSDEEFSKIALVHELGNHGASHTPLPALSNEQIEQELHWGAREIARYAAPQSIVAPPDGRINHRVLRCLYESGYVVRTTAVLRNPAKNPLVLSPTFMFYPHSSATMLRSAAKHGALPALPLLRAWGASKPFSTRAKDVLTAAVRSFPVVHVWGHSEEVARLDAWDVLHDLLAFARELGVEPVTNGGLRVRP